MLELSRRDLLRIAGIGAAGAAAAACVPPTAPPAEKPVEKDQPAVKGPPETIVLRVMTRAGMNGDHTRHFAQEYANRTDGVEVKLEDTIYGELMKKAELGFVSGTMTDTVYNGTKWYDYACYKNMFLAIDDLVASNPLGYDDYYPGMLLACEFDGKLFGLPGDSHPHARELLLWNKTHIEAAGEQWPPDKDLDMEDWKRIAIETTQPDKGIFGTSMGSWNYYDFDCVVLMPFGARILNEDGSKLTLLEDEKTDAAIKWWLELVEAHATPYREDLLESGNMFYAGKMVTANSGLSGVVGIDKATEGGKLWQWDWTLVPSGPAGRGSQAFINQWCVSIQSKHPEHAYALCSLTTSTEAGIWATVNMRKQPNGSRPAWYSKEVAEKEPAFAACAEWLDDPNLVRFPMPKNLRFQEFYDTWSNISQPMMYGEKTWDEVVPELKKACQEVLDLPLP